MAMKSGPLTVEDLQEIWRSTNDEGFTEPFLRKGEGEGLEAHSQLWEVFARVSQAIDTTTQAMFILPWSGQTDEPAQGEAHATVTLTFSRTKRLNEAITLTAGQIVVAQELPDWSPTGTVLVEPEPALQPSPGLRLVRIHPLADLRQLPGILEPWTGKLQGAALAGADAWELAGSLESLGVSRLAGPGDLQSPDATWHNGGRHPLAALGGALSAPWPWPPR